MTAVRVGPHTIEVSNAGKVLFPDDGITKGDVVDYYGRIADEMVPHLEARPHWLTNVFRRLGRKRDPWKGLNRHARSIAGLGDRLGRA